MTQGQKTCRTIAWAFSIVALVGYIICAVAFFIEYSMIKSTSIIDNVAEVDQILLPFGIVCIILASAQIVFIILNNKSRKDEKSHIALGILQIIFGDLVAGILMLCSGGKS